MENLDSGVGIYAPDAEAYTVFADIFDPIIEDYHSGFKKSDKHPAKDWGDVKNLVNLDPTGEFVVSTRVRCGRSLEGYPFNPCLTEVQYKEMQEKVSSTLSAFAGDLKGIYDVYYNNTILKMYSFSKEPTIHWPVCQKKFNKN